MPQKAVYGKRPNKASAFAVSNVFLNSSPTKVPQPKTARTSKRDHGTIEAATIALEKLDIVEDHENRDIDQDVVSHRRPDKKENRTGKPRTALGDRDANRRGPTKTREMIQRHSRIIADEKSAQEIVEDAVAQDEVVPQIASIMSRDHDEKPTIRTTTPDPSCDPYIAPLISLTDGQTLPKSFQDWCTEFAPHFRIDKIAEASYGEVYRFKLLTPHPSLTSADDREAVFKVLAVKPDPAAQDPKKKKSKAQTLREEKMSELASVESEVKLLKRMTLVPGFTYFRGLHVLKGRPPQLFINTWKEWNEGRKRGEKSEFPDPSKSASYSDDTIWAVIEMQDAGTDVDQLQNKDQLTSVFEVWDVFWQVVIAIAKGEEDAKFEHRDLHCGNVCVRDRRSAQHDNKDLSKRTLGFTNLETTIIDYTLSRAELPRSGHPPSFSISTSSRRSSVDSDDGDKEIAYLDLKDASLDWLFTADATQEYQYEMYRHMRSALYFSDPCKSFDENEEEAYSNGRTWKGFHPQTNLVWLWWILYKLLGHMNRPHQNDAKALELAGVLRKVERILDLEKYPRAGLMSAGSLVARALGEGWLDDADVRYTSV
ncbi:hypothetical protein FKW77_001063 [Venturia effusa]|uniref:non-specific serine/threonine protein kinase n=1 Tax=Venturia effusa TaxID=50376 RepID=A0A517L0Q3_9PEZI|nr:hypothetical protein FKW77_001063 [Venturia effusa]